MSVIALAKTLLKKGYICNNCLGRQFGQLLTGMSNFERGKILRMALAMEYEAKPYKTDISNFYDIKFRSRVSQKKPPSCWVCKNFFERVDRLTKRIEKNLKGYEFDTFVVGNNPKKEWLSAEDKVWKIVGFKWSEDIKSEINRELGKALEKSLGKKADEKSPDITIFIDFSRSSISIKSNPLYIKGYYKKLERGIPQTRHPGYRTSVHQIIERPIMTAAKGETSLFHGAGREDIDVRCLDWRPFVLEIKNPKRRTLSLKRLERIICSKSVKVKDLKRVDKLEVLLVKQARQDKTYEAIIESEKPIKDLSRLSALKGKIEQFTPTRVAARRAKKLRKRNVKEVKWKKISSRKFKLIVKADAGLYVKELITGDGGRTKPSASDLLGCNLKIKTLDVIKIWPEQQKA